MPPRTNACALCRKKRIKCDATVPRCLMCFKLGHECPGVSSDPIIIQISSTDMASKRKSKKKSKSTEGSSLVPPTTIRSSNFEALPQDFTITMSIQISQRHVVNEAFFKNFLDYFTTSGEAGDIQNRHTWLHHLPMLSTDGTSTALTLAVHATASAFSFTRTRHIPLMEDACNLYGRALTQHSHALRAKKKVTIHTVSTSVLLSLFEAMNATTAAAYRQHISGAAELVKQAGPQECAQGVLCQLFFHIRVQMQFVYLTTREEDRNAVCSEQVLRETLTYFKMPILQRLINHLTKLTRLYLELDDGADTKVPEGLFDLQEYTRVKADVDELWCEYNLEAEARGEILTWTTMDGGIAYRDAYTALCISYFASARVLFSVLAPRLAASYLDFTDYYQQILDIADYLTAFQIGCAFMRMATPLYLVAMHARREEQRARATRMFEEWRVVGLGGISEMALESIYRRQAGGNCVRQKAIAP